MTDTRASIIGTIEKKNYRKTSSYSMTIMEDEVLHTKFSRYYILKLNQQNQQ